MLSIHSLLPLLKQAYPQLSFRPGTDFSWSPSEQVVYFEPHADDQWVMLLHETAHGLLRHTDYTKDVELLKLERQAWDRAQELARGYHEMIQEEVIEANLDSYRDWLHSRSTCPACRATGVQVKRRTYSCLACRHHWLVNEARTCALRRYVVTSI